MENLKNSKKEKTWLDTIIKNLLIKNFYQKFITLNKHRIYIKNIYNFLYNDLNITWLKEKLFNTKARYIYQNLMEGLSRYKKNKNLKRIQRKYPQLQIIEAYYYLKLKGKFSIKEEDIETFDEMIDILLAKLIREKKK